MPEYANRPDFIRRFEAEAQLVAHLEHMHIVPLYDYWRDPQGAYLVMRLMKGGSLADSIKESGPWEPGAAARLVEQIASALDAAHQQGVVHRDLKPANILLDEVGNAYLSDFGIAKEISAAADITQTGAIIGTPAYITPEQVQGQPVTAQTDIYSLGVVVYELLVGGHPFPDTPTGNLIVKHLSQPLPLVHADHPALPVEVDQVIQRATAKSPAERYSNAMELAADFQRALHQELILPGALEKEIYNPYKGLRAFQETDYDDFFGRGTLTKSLIARLADNGSSNRFLAVVGPSGSGKSSAVKAGLLPALREGALPGSEKWFITEIEPGTHPFEELELALLRIATDPRVNLAEQLRRDERGLLRAVRLALPGEDYEMLLVIDQFEELFTLVERDGEADLFLDSLYEAVTDPTSRLRLVITLRADFYDRPLNHAQFGALVQAGTEVILPLSSEELQEAIRCPAERLGVAFDEGLVTDIVTDVVDQPGVLPLLQYALTELFERRDGRLLAQKTYKSIGGVLGALGRRAEEVYEDLSQASKESARQVFLRLVTLGEGVEDTRRRVLQSELEALSPTGTSMNGERESGTAANSAEGVRGVLESFGRARLLSFDRDPVTRGSTVEVAHEALLGEWRRLHGWLDESRADIRMQRVLGNAADEWLTAGRDASFLLRGSRLEQFEAWAATTDLALTQAEGEYLEACLADRRTRQAAEAERQAQEALMERRSRRFLRGLVAVLGLAVIVAAILTAYALSARNQARTQQVVAEEQAALAFSRELTEASFGVLGTDPELGALLALQALSQADTPTAQSALHQAVPALHLATNLVGHQDLIQGLAVSPDGQLLATASQDGTVTVWNLESGTELATLDFKQGDRQLEGRPAIAVAFSTDGRYLATAGFDQVARVWELESESGEELLHANLISTLIGHTGIINAIQFSPDGKLLVTAGGDKSIILWDVEKGEQIHALIGHMPFLDYPGSDSEPSRKVKPPYTFSKPGISSSLKIKYLSGATGVAFTPRGGQFVSTNVDGIVTLWDGISGEMIDQFGTNTRIRRLSEIPSRTIPDSQFVFIKSGHYGSVLDIDMSPSGDYFATASIDGMVKVWELSNFSTPMLIFNQDAFSLAFNPDGSHLAIGSRDGIIRIFDLEYGRELVAMSGHTGAIYDMAYTPQGRLISVGEDKLVRIWDPNPAGEIFALSNPHPILSVALSPDGEYIAAGLENKSAEVWDRDSGESLYPPLISQNVSLTSVEFSPDGRFLVTSNMDVWDASSGELTCRLLGHTDNVTAIAFSSQGTQLASASYDNTIKVWDIRACEIAATPIAELSGHENWVEDIAFSPDGGTIASIGWDKTVILWDWHADSIKEKWTTEIMATSLAISPSGERLALGDQEGNLAVWDISAESPQLSFSVPGHTGYVFDLDFSTDGMLVATASSDGEVKVWDAVNGEEMLSLFGHEGVATGVEFSPDGTWLISSGTDGVIRGYTLSLTKLKELAGARLTRSLTEEECRKYLHMDSCLVAP